MSLLRYVHAKLSHALHRPAPRSKQWPHARAEHLKKHPQCAACGLTDHAEVHHVTPFHMNAALELDPSNLVTLCLSPAYLCHLQVGHGGSFKQYNPNVLVDAGELLAARRRVDPPAVQGILKRAKASRLANVAPPATLA